MSNVCLIQGIDHLEFYVGSAKQTAWYFSQCFGFSITAYSGLETGDRKTASYILEQGNIRFVVSSALCPNHPIARSVTRHGDTIAVIGMAVTNVDQIYRRAVQAGAVGVIPPTQQKTDAGVIHFATIRIFGETVIKFIDRSQYWGSVAPGFVAWSAAPTDAAGLQQIDHIVGNVEFGMMQRWVDFFVQTMGFSIRQQFTEKTIATPNSALSSIVLQNGTQTTFNINQPAIGRRQSQIDEFLQFHQGAGIQHIGLITEDIVATVRHLKQAGVEFLPIPMSYYDSLPAWVNRIHIPLEQLAELNILVDRDQEGYLLQLFTQPISDRPTLFFEVIERRGATGFGEGNFQSLFVALEREQALRGNL